ncbi:MAG TPA: molybdate ABC transporter substrate-binding protein [Polyangiales bacterium]|nr:molybdate ABC transporter substrate-binding protein [Polyangiales bacterium]
MPAGADSQELLVFAAASLRETFGAIAATYEREHAGWKVILNLAGSQELRTQLEQGAPADVFAVADLKQLAPLHTAGLVATPRTFARNEPVLIAPKGSPLAKFTDLSKAERIVIGTPEVPIGAYTLQILDKAAARLGAKFKADVLGHVVSHELNVRQVLAKVTLGEADAGVVYRTDALTAKDQVRVISIPAELNVVAEYPIATVKASKHAEAAQAFVSLVTSARGAQQLKAAGFSPVTGKSAVATAK